MIHCEIKEEDIENARVFFQCAKSPETNLVHEEHVRHMHKNKQPMFVSCREKMAGISKIVKGGYPHMVD